MNIDNHTVGVGAVTLVGLVIAALISIMTGNASLFSDQLTVHVVLGDAAGTTPGSAVKIAGVTIGSVSALTLQEGKAHLTLQIDADASVTDDMIVQVRARSLLGEKYIALLPSTQRGALIVDGETLVATKPSLDIDDVLNHIGPLLESIDGDTLSRTLGALSQAIESDPQRIERMLTDAEVLLDNTAASSAQLPALLEQTQQTLQRVDRAAHSGEQTLQALSTTVERVDALALEGQDIAANANALITETRSAVQHGEEILTVLVDRSEDIEAILDNLKDIDRWELRRLLREEGILVRLKPAEVTPAP